MIVYRICLRAHSALDGEGARLFGGRWNNPGPSVLYTSAHLSLAALEYLVHVDFDNLPMDLVWLRIELPDACSVEHFPDPTAPSESGGKAFGDTWLNDRRSLALMVPSAVISVEKNIILNPRHGEMASVRTLETARFDFDQRLFKR